MEKREIYSLQNENENDKISFFILFYRSQVPKCPCVCHDDRRNAPPSSKLERETRETRETRDERRERDGGGGD